MIKRILKWIGLSFLGLILLLVLATTIFLYTAPQIGASPSGDHLAQISQSAQYTGEGFENLGSVTMDQSAGNMMDMIGEFFFGEAVRRSPAESLPMTTIDPATLADAPENALHVTWFGHSAVYMEMDGKRIFLDPMLGDYCAPLSWLGPNRWPNQMPMDLKDVPELDVVVISHDHYDHLDYTSILELQERTKMFLVPLGIAAHLERWGVPTEKIREFDWWDEAEIDGLRFVCTPSQHFSGRGLADRGHTLWCSWVVEGKKRKVFFSGDSGYFDGFADIGEKEGPFDFVMMECGQYNEMWKEIHMMPEETYQAFNDVRGKVLMPIHWGAFELALHEWDDPIKRVTAAAEADGARVAAPIIGQTFTMGNGVPYEKWWQDIN